MTRPGSLELPSDRSFGITFAVVFALIGAVGAWKGTPYAGLAGAVSLLFIVVALAAPRVLRPLNVVWMRIGAIMNVVVSPVVLGVLFYGVITPYGAALRMFGRDVLHRRFQRDRASYWIPRDPAGPEPASFRRQF